MGNRPCDFWLEPSTSIACAEDPRRIASMVHPSPILPRALDLVRDQGCFGGGLLPCMSLEKVRREKKLNSSDFELKVPFLAVLSRVLRGGLLLCTEGKQTQNPVMF